MDKELQVDIFEMWRIVIRRRWMILSFLGLFAIGGAMAYLMAPTIYRCQSTIALPGEPYRWTTVPEVKEVVAAAIASASRGESVLGLDGDEMGNLVGVKVQEVAGSETMFRLVVKTKSEPALALKIAEILFTYLTTRAPVQERLRIMIAGADSSLVFAEKAFLTESHRTAGRANAQLLALYDKLVEYRIRRASLRNFEYISLPTLDPAPVSPRPWLNVSLAALIGLMFGSVLAVFTDRQR